MASSKSLVCAHDWHVTANGITYDFGCIYANRGLCISLPSPQHHLWHQFNQNYCRMSVWRKKECCNHQYFGQRGNTFLDQCYELLCFILHNVADLRHGWITLAFPPARKNVETRHKKWHKWETHQSVNPYGMAQITTWSIENTHLDPLLYPCLSKWNHALFNFYFLDFCHSCVPIQYRYKCNHPLNLPEQLSYTYTED